MARTNTLLFTCLSLAATATSLICGSESQPNPIAVQYPKEVTGTINGTTAIVPIPYSVARSIVPSQYPILRSAYEKLIPGFPKDSYPAEFEGLLDHDVQSNSGLFKLPDFQRIALRFPFVDRLNDGYSCFRYTAPQIITATNAIALIGSEMYGETYPGSFAPDCEAYARVSGCGMGATYLNATDVSLDVTRRHFNSEFWGVKKIPFEQKLFINITNQPSFGSGLPVCDNYITLYNSSVTQAPYTPVPVEGFVIVEPPYYPETAKLKAFGYRMDNSFIERNNVPCGNLKGYHGTGSGDSG